MMLPVMATRGAILSKKIHWLWRPKRGLAHGVREMLDIKAICGIDLRKGEWTVPAATTRRRKCQRCKDLAY